MLTPSPCASPVLRRGSRASASDGADDEVTRLLTDGRPSQHALTLNVPPLTPSSRERWERINSPYPDQRAAGERTRRKLQFFFMNPVDKWRARKRPPYKLALQLVKVVFVTLQLALFATRRYSHVTYLQNSQLALQHLLLLGWDVSREVSAYPPSVGPLAAYSQQRFYDTLDHAVNSYYDLSHQTVGGVAYPGEVGPRAVFCVDEYRAADVRPENLSYVFDDHERRRCLDIKPDNGTVARHNFSTAAYLQQRNFSLSFYSLRLARLSLGLNAVKLKLVMPLDVPDCYYFNVTLALDNRNHDGQILVRMDIEADLLQCAGSTEFITDDTEIEILFTLINLIVIGICSMSFIMCVRALYRAQLMRRETSETMLKYFDYNMTREEHLRFLNLWYVLIIVNDVLIVVASLMKIQLENKLGESHVDAENWNACSVILGVGNLFVWIGVLRYLGFFRSYNVLILTVKNSLPSVIRFGVCASICYAGFLFCGWLILSPYHLKFRTLSRTSETLFSLMNGDDMFSTFAQTSPKSTTVFWFAKFYVYTFIFFFIYLVLSLMISIIMDSYETIKTYYHDGFPVTPLDEFMQVRRHDPTTGVYRQDQDEMLLFRLLTFCGGCCRPEADTGHAEAGSAAGASDSETTPLLGTVPV